MSIIVGQAVRGKNFWDRKYKLEDIWDAIENGSHVLISAPKIYRFNSPILRMCWYKNVAN